MDDEMIVELFFERNEQAITQTDLKYGALCRRIAFNILRIREDADECVNDTYLAAWDRIPPERPRSLRAFLGKMVRNIAISRLRKNTAQKRHGQQAEILLSELDDCVPDTVDVEDVADSAELSLLISRWLDSLSKQDRVLFIRRYWFGDSITRLAFQSGRFPNTVSQRLYQLRQKLKDYLMKEGVEL